MKFLLLTSIAGSMGVNLEFFNDACGNVQFLKFTYLNKQTGDTIQPASASKIKTIYWSYPTCDHSLNFYTSNTTKPYLTVTPTSNSYEGVFCSSLTTDKYFNLTRNETAMKGSSSYFLTDTSFVQIGATGFTSANCPKVK
ncbi:hypothetical protein HDV06_001020 [Boothiomyces sp. JEL0866]|nr:hypothetical protein HDV06_001020 [Boothiomyces sp. JEL0866]